MPTQADFELAATKLTLASEQVGDLVTTVASIDVTEILRGGTLGQLVPERIDEAVRTAGICQLRLDAVAEQCIERAAVIAAYMAELELYETLLAGFDVEVSQYNDRYWAWYDAPPGMMPAPGAEPTPPVAPVPPPAWAEVPLPTSSGEPS